MTRDVVVERLGAVTQLTLNREGSANAINLRPHEHRPPASDATTSDVTW